MSYIDYENIKNPTKKYDCEQTLLKSDLDTSLYNPLIEVIGKLNLIGNYIKNNEDSWSSEGSSKGGDTLEFPLSAINGLQTSSTNKILYYNNDGDWEYKDYKELKFPLSELYDLTSNNLDGTKWVLVYDQESSNGRGWKFLPYNTGTGSGLTPGKVAYNLNTVNNPDSNVKQILVWDNDGNGTYKWKVENYNSSSSGGLTWNDLINQGNEKIHSSHLPSSWWGRTISNNIVEGNLSGNIQYIKFDSGGHTVYLGLDSEGNLRVSKSENGNDGSSGANFYATGGVSALGNSSSSGGGGTPGETSLKSLLNNVNDLGTNYATPSTGYTIVYNGSNWVDRKLNLSELGDVLINNVSNNDVLTYNGINWINSPAQSTVSSLGQLNDVDDTVSDIKAQNVIQPSGSIQSYSYPLTLLVGSTSETSSNIYDSEVEWKQYVFQLETDSSAAHYIDGESLTSNMGIVTRLNFGQAGSPMNNYRFPTYITGVRQQNSDMTRYHITGAKHIKGKTINNNNQIWNLDYDETFCSDKVYIINDELYSNSFKVLTTDSTLSSSKLNNNSVTFNGASVSLGSIGTITPELVIDGNTIKSKVGNQTSGGITIPFATNATYATQFAAKRTLWGNDDYGYNSIGYQESSTINLAALRNVHDIVFGDGTIFPSIRYKTSYGDLNVFQLDKNEKKREVDGQLVSYNPKQYNNVLEIGWGSATTTGTCTRIWGSEITFAPKGNETVALDLTASGQTYLPLATAAATGLRIGNAVLYWDNNSKALALQSYNDQGQLTTGSFYATGGVSALGFSNGVSSIDAMTFGNLTITDSIDVANKIIFDSDYENDVYIKSTSSQLHLSSLDYIYLDTPVYNISIRDGSVISGIRIGAGNKLVFTIDGNEYNVSYT